MASGPRSEAAKRASQRSKRKRKKTKALARIRRNTGSACAYAATLGYVSCPSPHTKHYLALRTVHTWRDGEQGQGEAAGDPRTLHFIRESAAHTHDPGTPAVDPPWCCAFVRLARTSCWRLSFSNASLALHHAGVRARADPGESLVDLRCFLVFFFEL